jgi:hypothetical protein
VENLDAQSVLDLHESFAFSNLNKVVPPGLGEGLKPRVQQYPRSPTVSSKSTSMVRYVQCRAGQGRASFAGFASPWFGWTAKPPSMLYCPGRCRLLVVGSRLPSVIKLLARGCPSKQVACVFIKNTALALQPDVSGGHRRKKSSIIGNLLRSPFSSRSKLVWGGLVWMAPSWHHLTIASDGLRFFFYVTHAGQPLFFAAVASIHPCRTSRPCRLSSTTRRSACGTQTRGRPTCAYVHWMHFSQQPRTGQGNQEHFDRILPDLLCSSTAFVVLAL